MGFVASRSLLDSWLVNIKFRLKAGRSSLGREVVLEQEAGFLPQLQLLLYNMVNGDGDREGHRLRFLRPLLALLRSHFTLHHAARPWLVEIGREVVEGGTLGSSFWGSFQDLGKEKRMGGACSRTTDCVAQMDLF